MENKYKNIHQDLIELSRRNDSSAQFKLYKLYYKAMYNSCYRIVRCPAEAEDIMQESFLSAFKNISSFSGNVSYGSWLKRIVINKAIDFVKKKKIEIISLNEEVTIKQEEEDCVFENTIEEALKIKENIDKLAPGYGIILNLYLLEGYDHEEIAGILNISSSTSRSQYLRAKKSLILKMNEKDNSIISTKKSV